jgi:hypothetical protein
MRGFLISMFLAILLLSIAVMGYPPHQEDAPLSEANALRLKALTALPGLDDVRVRRIDRVRLLRARENIRQGMYAQPCAGEKLFAQDRIAMQALLELSCYTPIRLQEGQFISPGGIRVRARPTSEQVRFTDTGAVQCNFALKAMTDRALGLLLDAEEAFAEASVATGSCATPGALASGLAQGRALRSRGELAKARDAFASVWRRAVGCACAI